LAGLDVGMKLQVPIFEAGHTRQRVSETRRLIKRTRILHRIALDDLHRYEVTIKNARRALARPRWDDPFIH
jgi:hypothetical protein